MQQFLFGHPTLIKKDVNDYLKNGWRVAQVYIGSVEESIDIRHHTKTEISPNNTIIKPQIAVIIEKEPKEQTCKYMPPPNTEQW